MVDSAITGGGVAASILAYFGMFLFESVSGLEISIVEKLGGAGLVGLGVYYLISHLLKRNDNLTNKIDELNEQRIKTAEKHFEEIKDLLKPKK